MQRAHDVRTAAHATLDPTTATAAGQSAACNISSARGGAGAWQDRQQHLAAITAVIDEAESVVRLLAEGQVPDSYIIASLVIRGMDAVTVLMQRISRLESRVEEEAAERQRQVGELQLQMGELHRQQVQVLRQDSDSLLFRELATQTVSKIVRKATGCTIWEARQAPLQVAKGTEAYSNITLKYPLLKIAVQTACDMGRPIAHPVTTPVTEESLRNLIKRVLRDAVVRPAAEQLLACLVELAADFKEDLFMASAPPT